MTRHTPYIRYRSCLFSMDCPNTPKQGPKHPMESSYSCKMATRWKKRIIDAGMEEEDNKNGDEAGIEVEDDTMRPGKISHRTLRETRGDGEVFPQGCQFSPDGLCILTAESNELALYNVEASEGNEWNAALRCPAGDAIRDYAFYPHMDSRDPSSCCFLGTARDQPVHLYDAYTGAVRATYRPFNRLDEMESPTSVCFANNGMSVVVGGFRTDRMLQLFDLNRPGRDASVILKLGKTRRSTDGQKGLVSALAVASVESNLLAVGTYSPGSIYLYDLRVQFAPVAEIIIDGACVVGHGKSARKRKHLVDDAFSTAKTRWYHSRTRGGVTQVKFTADSQSLLSLSRRSNTVLQWDVRRLSSSYAFCAGVASYETRNNTNQRLEFTLDGNEKLYIGGQDRCVRVYDLKQCVLLDTIDCVFGDSVNGVSVHQLAGQTLMATTTGSRHFPSDSEWDLDFPHGAVKDKVVGCVCLSELS